MVDSGNGRVQVFEVDGGVLSIIGERGQQPGELTIPGDCVIDPGDRLFVVGMANEMVSAFDLAGEFLHKVFFSLSFSSVA